jgi:hypothetical protein
VDVQWVEGWVEVEIDGGDGTPQLPGLCATLGSWRGL